ncbi:nuclear pore complex protein Nup214 isoform X2 [Triplophysa rosa]|uniref:nuclear pore complex protein Nup214 isoform X2 n=1 Tax=Triplophysa rosa TaxID=992332 RepID=UPI0025461082|nr:nuclear pore complex protein Nup214 isoform X2 [Triplophysa rosa]
MMAEDTDSVPDREMKDFQFRQLKKIRLFAPPGDLPKERSNLLAVSNKYGLTFAGQDGTLKVFLTRDVMAVGHVEANPNEIVENVSAVTVSVHMSMHHLALSSDELTLSVCGMQDAAELTVDFYDVRTFYNKSRQEKRPFASFGPAATSNVVLQDLKWSPVDASRLALCLSDGSMMVLDVQDSVNVLAQQPASAGVTCVCWSPKGKQVAVGKQDATVVQFTPTLQAKKVIPCPRFYSQENPVTVLDVLWLSTYSFGVVYAAADGSLETPPDLVMVSLPNKTDQRTELYMNFNDLVFGACTVRQHHFYLCHIEDWDLVLAASAASAEVSVIAKQPDKVNWELWLLEDASRAELPVTMDSEDTLPVGVAIDYTSQEEIQLSDEKRVPPAPTLMILSTDGVLCPFSLLNLNPRVKPLTNATSPLPVDCERAPYTKSLSAPAVFAAIPSFPASSSSAPPLASLTFAAPPPAYTSTAAPPPGTAAPPPACVSSSAGFSFSLPAQGSVAPSHFSLNSTSSSFSFSAPKPSSEAPSGFSFGSAALKEVSSSTPQRMATPIISTPNIPAEPAPQRMATPIISTPNIPAEPATPAVRMNLADRFLAVETPASSIQPFSLTSTPKPAASDPISQPASVLNFSRAPPAMSRPAQSFAPPLAVQKTAPVAPPASTSAPSAQGVSAKTPEKRLQQKKVLDPVMVGIHEEIEHFQKELDELKTRCRNFDFIVGSTDEMRELRKESENLHTFAGEIKETTESVHGDIRMLKTSLLEGFAGAEEATAQSELNRDKDYLQLLYKKPLDPRREEQLKEIRRMYQYVKFAMEDVNDVLDLEWEKHLEKRKKQRHMVVPEIESLFAALANHLDIIHQQNHRLEKLLNDLHKLRLYKRTSAWSLPSRTPSTPSQESLDSELESLKDALLKASLDTAPRAPVKSPSKMTPAKQTQLRNFLSKRQTPPVRSTAPANLSRSAFLFPQYSEDEVSSTSSLSQPLEPEDTLALAEEEEEPGPIPIVMPSVLRHPAVVRTPSIQPGFIMQSAPFGRVLTGPVPVISSAPKIIMDSADSTALATKTVKHGAPPTERTTPTTIPATQAAARAALNRYMSSQKPGAPLTESTLKVVPQVVNVQELRDDGPPAPVSTVISSSVPTPAAQVVQQVLATVEASKNSFQGGLKVSAPLAGAAQSTPVGFLFAAAADAGVTSSSATDRNSKAPSSFSFSAAPGFSFTSTSQSQDNTQAKSSTLPGKFSFASGTAAKKAFGSAGSEESFSFAPKLTSPAQNVSSSTPPPASAETATLPPAPKAQGGAGETLGCFSGLRVGQTDEASKAMSFSFGSSSNGSTGFTFSPPQIKPVESAASSDSVVPKAEGPKTTTLQAFGLSSTFPFKPQEGTPLSTTPAFTIPSTTSFPPSATSFGSLLQAPLPETVTKSPQTEASSSTELAVSEVNEPPADPSCEPTTSVTPSTKSTPEGAASSQPASVDTTVPSTDTPSVPSALTPEVTPPPPATVTPPVEVTPVTKPPADTVSAPASEVTTGPAPTPASQEPPAASDATPSAPPSDKPGSIFAPTSGGTDGPMLGAVNLTPVVSTAAPSTPSNPPVTSTPSAAPVAAFGQPPAAAFGSPGFGTPAASGFSKPAFGQSTGAGFGQPAAPGSASGFTFGQSAFGGAVSGFGQPAAPAAVTTTSSDGGGLFGSSTGSGASSFSFAAPTSSASSTGAGHFGQSSAPVFGQPSSGFGQGSLFGNNTTTSSSSGFGFGQQSGFGSSTVSSSVFGQQTSGTSVFGQAQSGGGLFGSSAGTASSGSGFFSGLGGKPSEDAANKNPFGSTGAGGFGQSVAAGSSSLFGNSAAKGLSSFGEQKTSGSFSTGAGSVAAQGFGSFSTPTKPGGFGNPPLFGSPPSFGGSPAFGAPSNFGPAPSFSSPLGGSSSTGKVFGEGTAAANVGGFGFASPSNAPTFGSIANQNTAPPPSFGSIANQNTAPPPSFGSISNQNTAPPPSFGSISNQNTAPPPSFGSMAQQPPGFAAPNTGFPAFGSPGGVTGHTLQTCICGWSKITSYRGLRIHQGKMKCLTKF